MRVEFQGFIDGVYRPVIGRPVLDRALLDRPDIRATDQFTLGSARYTLQLSLPAGATTFPTTKTNTLVAFYNGDDSSKEWSAGTTKSPGRGTVSLTGKKGTISATLGYSPPESTSPALGPVTVSGTFTCP